MRRIVDGQLARWRRRVAEQAIEQRDLDLVTREYHVRVVEALVAERDHYKAGLTEIASEDYRGPEPSGRRIARRYLGPRS